MLCVLPLWRPEYYDFVDEEEEAPSSSGVLILALGCEISATLGPLLKQNLCPGFTFLRKPIRDIPKIFTKSEKIF